MGAFHAQPEGITFVNEIPSYNLIIIDEIISELTNQYGANVMVSIKVEELISLFPS